jgi:hypothetical protein
MRQHNMFIRGVWYGEVHLLAHHIQQIMYVEIFGIELRAHIHTQFKVLSEES